MKRFWADLCVQHVEAVLYSDYAALEAELRDRLDVMTQCADNYSRMFEESAEECERLRKDNLSLRGSCKELGNTNKHHTRLARKSERERDTLCQQRDRLAELLADVKADYTHAIHWEDMHATMKRIDAALAEVKPCPESQSPAPTT